MMKISLKDGTRCGSKVEAWFYLAYKNQGLEFLHNGRYGGLGKRGWCRYDFFFPRTNTYVEVTGYDGTQNHVWPIYMKKIEKKRRFVEDQLGARFQFVSHPITLAEKRYVESHMVNSHRVLNKPLDVLRAS